MLKQRGCHVEENPGNKIKKMVLFLMFFPGFRFMKAFSLSIDATEMCPSLLMECKQSKVSSSLHLFSSIETGLDGCQHTFDMLKKDQCFLDQRIGRKSSGGSHYRQPRCIQASCRGTL